MKLLYKLYFITSIFILIGNASLANIEASLCPKNEDTNTVRSVSKTKYALYFNNHKLLVVGVGFQKLLHYNKDEIYTFGIDVNHNSWNYVDDKKYRLLITGYIDYLYGRRKKLYSGLFLDNALAFIPSRDKNSNQIINYGFRFGFNKYYRSGLYFSLGSNVSLEPRYYEDGSESSNINKVPLLIKFIGASIIQNNIRIGYSFQSKKINYLQKSLNNDDKFDSLQNRKTRFYLFFGYGSRGNQNRVINTCTNSATFLHQSDKSQINEAFYMPSEVIAYPEVAVEYNSIMRLSGNYFQRKGAYKYGESSGVCATAYEFKNWSVMYSLQKQLTKKYLINFTPGIGLRYNNSRLLLRNSDYSLGYWDHKMRSNSNATIAYNILQIAPYFEVSFYKKIIIAWEFPLNMFMINKIDASYNYEYSSYQLPNIIFIDKNTTEHFNETKSLKYLVDNNYFVNYINFKVGFRI